MSLVVYIYKYILAEVHGVVPELILKNKIFLYIISIYTLLAWVSFCFFVCLLGCFFVFFLFACLGVFFVFFCLLAWVSVCLYPINVKTAKLIGPKFCVGPHMTPGKIYEWSKFQKGIESDFLISISLEPNVGDLRYFKLWILLDQII